MEVGKRYDGIYYESRKCKSSLEVVNIPIYFSFKVERIDEDGTVIIHRFSPPKVEGILLDKEIFLVKEITETGDLALLKAKISQVVGGGLKIVVEEKEIIKEKRFFDRFYFCPEDLETFKLSFPYGKETLGDAYITNISLTGVEIFSSTVSLNSVKVGDLLVLTQGDKEIKFKVIRKRELKARGILFLAGTIEERNFDLMNYLIKNYVKVVKKLLYKEEV